MCKLGFGQFGNFKFSNFRKFKTSQWNLEWSVAAQGERGQYFPTTVCSLVEQLLRHPASKLTHQLFQMLSGHYMVHSKFFGSFSLEKKKENQEEGTHGLIGKSEEGAHGARRREHMVPGEGST